MAISPIKKAEGVTKPRLNTLLLLAGLAFAGVFTIAARSAVCTALWYWCESDLQSEAVSSSNYKNSPPASHTALRHPGWNLCNKATKHKHHFAYTLQRAHTLRVEPNRTTPHSRHREIEREGARNTFPAEERARGFRGWLKDAHSTVNDGWWWLRWTSREWTLFRHSLFYLQSRGFLSSVLKSTFIGDKRLLSKL